MRQGLLLTGVLVLALASVPVAAVVNPGGTFIDDDANFHESAIEAIRTAGISEGCSPLGDLYCPTNPVSRAEMAAFLVRALGEQGNLSGHLGTFSDVPAGLWYTGYVERLSQLGITSGYPDGTFRPAAPVSRLEMAAFLVRALNESASSATGTFVDVAAGQWYTGHVERLSELGVTTGCATNPARFCPFDQVLRDQMASFLVRAFNLPTETVPPRPSVQGLALDDVTVADGLTQPVFVAAPPGDDRLFIVEQPGVIRLLKAGVTSTFLDIRSLVASGGERGLLGLAFHPGYSTNGRFYVDYTDNAGDTRVVEYQVSQDPDRADAASARELLFVDQPAANHNGGMLAFGPDGKLYVALGDGGGGGDTYGNGQNLGTLLGTITRLDVDTAAREIFAYGLRNPWRFSFDGQRLYIADVGQGAREEVDVISTFDSLPNLGWPITEGTRCYPSGSGCQTAGLTLPVVEYSHSQGCSVTGGFVYRGVAIPELQGHYLYGDYCSGWVRSFRYAGSTVVDAKDWSATIDVPFLTSFGFDGFGELYLTSSDGTVRKIVRG